MTGHTTVDDLLGWHSLTTLEYKRSQLREAVEFGYVLILDEIDAAQSAVLLALNGLKDDTFTFPDGTIDIHPDFRLIATANTLEYDEQYNARHPLDRAILDRFKTIEYNMEPYHLALRYGYKYISQIDLEDKTPRAVEREVRELRIAE